MSARAAVAALLVLALAGLGDAAGTEGIAVTIFRSTFLSGEDLRLGLGFHQLAEGTALSARVPRGLFVTFYENADGNGPHLHLSDGNANDFIASGFKAAPLSVLIELAEGALLTRDGGVNWRVFPVGVHDLRSYPMFANGAGTKLVTTDLVQATLFTGPGCAGASRVVSGDVGYLDDLAIDEEAGESSTSAFGGTLHCIQVERKYGAVIYERPQFQGARAYVRPGAVGDALSLLPAGSRIASVRLQDQVDVRLYAERFFVDHYVLLEESMADMSLTGLNDARSLKVNVNCLRPCVNGDCTASPDYCKCSRGWFGDACDEFACDPPCEHGKCSVESEACHCEAGWSGRACNIAYCPQGCHHGSCVAPNKCLCQLGYTGTRCDRPAMRECGNGQCQGALGETCTSCPVDCGECPTVPIGGRRRGPQGVKTEEERLRIVEEASRITEEDLTAIVIIGGICLVIVLVMASCGLHIASLVFHRSAAKRAANRSKHE